MHLKPQMPSSMLTKLLRTEKDHERNYKGGARGGRDQFDWDSVKEVSYKNRECYLGYSSKIGYQDKAGKWKRNDWYKAAPAPEAKTSDERRRELKRQEQEAMDVALGLKRTEMEDPKVKPLTGKSVEVFSKRIKHSERDLESETAGLGFRAEPKRFREPSKADLGRNDFELPEKKG